MIHPELSEDPLSHLNEVTEVASDTECTGLIPRAPVDPEERKAYEELYPYLPPTPPRFTPPD